MSTIPRSRRRSPRKAAAGPLALTPAFERILCESAGLSAAPAGRRAALVRAVRGELASYRAATICDAHTPGTAGQRAAISELLRAAEALLRAFGDLDPKTAAVLTDGRDGIDTVAWARDLHGLWNRLLALDRQFEAHERLRSAPRRELDRTTLGRLVEAYTAHAGSGGDLLTFLRHACETVSLSLPPTDEKLISVISKLPTLA
jgi:hypothetical protein